MNIMDSGKQTDTHAQTEPQVSLTFTYNWRPAQACQPLAGAASTRTCTRTPGRPLEEERSGIDCLRMREVFRILSSKFDRKLNFP